MGWDTFRKQAMKRIKLSNKWSAAMQSQFLLQLSELLKEGFSLHDALTFLAFIFEEQKESITKINQELAKGATFEYVMKEVGFSEMVCSQLYLSQQHGQFVETLFYIGDFLRRKRAQLELLMQTLAYPLFLIVFVLTLLFLMREWLLPQLDVFITEDVLSKHLYAAVVLFVLTYLPHILISICCVVGGLVLVGRRRWKKKTPLERLRAGLKVPILKKWILLYCSFHYSREFSYFLSQGQSLHQMVHNMMDERCSILTQEIAFAMQQSLVSGEGFSVSLQRIGIFKQELIAIVVQGELTNQLAIQLEKYAQRCLDTLVKDVSKKIQWIQPILFLSIGVCIVSIYALILLPTLSMLER